MDPFQAIQNQAQQAGASAAQGAIAQAQGALPGLAQQAAQQATQQLQAAQGAIQSAGAAAGAGAREGVLGDLSTGTVAAIGVGAVALLGLVGFAAYRAGKKDEGVNALKGGRPDDLALSLIEYLSEHQGVAARKDLTDEAWDLIVSPTSPMRQYFNIGHSFAFGDTLAALNKKGQQLAREAGVQVYVHPIVDYEIRIADYESSGNE